MDAIDFVKREESVTLSKGMQGKHAWEIKFYRREGETDEELVGRLCSVDNLLRDKYNQLNMEEE